MLLHVPMILPTSCDNEVNIGKRYMYFCFCGGIDHRELSYIVHDMMPPRFRDHIDCPVACPLQTQNCILAVERAFRFVRKFVSTEMHPDLMLSFVALRQCLRTAFSDAVTSQ